MTSPSWSHDVTELESSLQQSRDTERGLTERCGELSAELADWKCRLDDALRLVDSKDSELRRSAAEHLTDVDHWSEKVEQLMSTNCDLETSQATTKSDLMDAELREKLLRKNMEELNSQLSQQENSAAQMKDQMNNQFSAVQERLFQVENCLEAKELEHRELEKSYDVVQSALKHAEEEKSQLLMTLSEVRKERNDARDELMSLNETLSSLQDRLLSSSNKCCMLEEWISDINAKNDTHQLVWQSRVETAEADKCQLLSRITQLENTVRTSDLSTITSAVTLLIIH